MFLLFLTKNLFIVNYILMRKHVDLYHYLNKRRNYIVDLFLNFPFQTFKTVNSSCYIISSSGVPRLGLMASLGESTVVWRHQGNFESTSSKDSQSNGIDPSYLFLFFVGCIRTSISYVYSTMFYMATCMFYVTISIYSFLLFYVLVHSSLTWLHIRNILYRYLHYFWYQGPIYLWHYKL